MHVSIDGHLSGQPRPARNGSLRRLLGSDVDLVERCTRGDERAWLVIVTRFQELVTATAIKVGLDPDDAEDVTQEVWIELHRRIGEIEKPESLPRWLEVASRRLSYKVVRRQRRFVHGGFWGLVDTSMPPDEQAALQDFRERVELVLEEMGGNCGRLIREFFFSTGDPGYRGIAERTGLAVGSVGPIRGRCLRRLRVLLEEEGIEEVPESPHPEAAAGLAHG